MFQKRCSPVQHGVVSFGCAVQVNFRWSSAPAVHLDTGWLAAKDFTKAIVVLVEAMGLLITSLH